MKSLSTIMLVLCLAVAFSLPDTAWAAKVHGVFRVVKGKVFVISGKSGKKKRAKVGKKVYPHDTVITKKDSRVKIVMIDKNVLNISPNSNIKIEKYEYNPKAGKKNVLLNVIYGKVRSKVKQKYNGKTAKFQVKTPSAVAGVRGTDFLTAFSRATKQTNIVTFEGNVKFGLPGANGSIMNAVSVKVGEMANNYTGRAPAQVVQLPKNDLKQMDMASDAEKAPKGAEPRMPAQNKEMKKDKKPKGKKSSADNSGRKNAESKRRPKQPDMKAEGEGPDDSSLSGKNNDQGTDSASSGPRVRPGLKGGVDPSMDSDVAVMPGMERDGMPRDPAAVGGSTETMPGMDSMPGMDGSMITNDDLAGGIGDDMHFMPPDMQTPDMGMYNPIHEIDGPIHDCEFCREAVEGKTTLIINVIKNP